MVCDDLTSGRRRHSRGAPASRACQREKERTKVFGREQTVRRLVGAEAGYMRRAVGGGGLHRGEAEDIQKANLKNKCAR